MTGRPSPRAPAARSRAEQVLRQFHEEQDLAAVFDRHLLARLWPFLRPHLRGLLLSIGLLLVIAALGLTRPLIMRDALSQPNPAGLQRAGLLLLGIVLLEQLLVFAQVYSLQVAGARAMHTLRSSIFSFLHRQRVPFFERQPIGRLVTRVTNDTDAVGDLFASGALTSIGDLVKLAGIVAMMLALDWRLSLFAFAVVPPIGLLVELVRKRARVAFRQIRVKLARLNAFLSEQVQGVAVVQSFCREEPAAREFDEINAAYRDANFRAITLEATLDASIEMVSSICIASILWYAGFRTWRPDVAFGTLVAFVAYIEQFFVPVRDLSSSYTLLQSAMSASERIFQLLDSEEPDAPARGQGQEDPSAPAFELDRVNFAYGTSNQVLHDVSLAAWPGEKVAIVGPTGSGKSTIASLLLRIYEPASGTVRVHGRDVSTLDREQLRSRFAVVPQEMYLFSGTIASNVAVGRRDPDRALVERCLRRAGAGELLDTRPGGLDAPVDERGANLSAGQRQLIAFARALYRDAPILVLDEATASVDSQTEASIQAGLEELLRGRTALVIAHRLSTIRAADRIVVLFGGRIAEQGTHDELVRRGGLYSKLYRLQIAQTGS